jgi:tartrate dehydratase beta subunit/fumarate hydratase class I family protein
VAKAITNFVRLDFREFVIKAIYEFEMKDSPVSMSVDPSGKSVHLEELKIWPAKIVDGIPGAQA